MPVLLPLKGVRIQLAGSIPNNSSPEARAGIESFVETLASAVFREGGCLIHGSHPSMLPPLLRAARPFVLSGGKRDALVLVRSHQFAVTDAQVAEIEALRHLASVEIIPPSSIESNQSLVSMRDWMNERSDAIVAVGGNWYDLNKARAGVPVELEDAIAQRKTAFVVTRFGGAIQGFSEDSSGLYSQLHNGLSESENRDLSESIEPAAAAEKIVQQFKRLPLFRGSIATNRMFRILALDGGGLRGVFTAAVLARWDEMLGKGGGNGLVKNFDLVAGTSTGAILAIGLGLGLSPKEILSFYREKGGAIFPKDRSVRHWLKSKHDSTTLRDMLQSVFDERKLSTDSCCRLVIPTVRAAGGQAEVIATAHHLDRTRYRDISAVDAALASSAAPTYFEEAEVVDSIASHSYLDGGIWANNPVIAAISEAIQYLNVPLGRIDVLSVGTLSHEADFSDILGKGKIGWASKSVDLFFAAQEHAALAVANSLLTPARHLRINQQTSSPIPLDDLTAIDVMIERGSNLGADTFSSVRSRFLDGSSSPDWRLDLS